MQTENPGFFAVIPAYVRYADIIPHAKLLYGEITALANKTGSCYASNAYFSTLYGVSVRQVSKWIGELEKSGFIAIKTEQIEGNRRYINISDTYRTKVPYLWNKSSIPYRTKVLYPIEQKFLYNNTFNNTNNNILIIEEEKKESFRILTVEEVKEVINKGKIQQDFFYKVGSEDSLNDTISDFLDHPSISKKILTVENTERNFRKWLKPIYETEEDRKILIQNYNKSNFKVSKTIVGGESDIEREEKKKNEDLLKKIGEIEKNIGESKKMEILEKAKKELYEEGRDEKIIGFKYLLKSKYNQKILSYFVN